MWKTNTSSLQNEEMHLSTFWLLSFVLCRFQIANEKEFTNFGDQIANVRDPLSFSNFLSHHLQQQVCFIRHGPSQMSVDSILRLQCNHHLIFPARIQHMLPITWGGFEMPSTHP